MRHSLIGEMAAILLVLATTMWHDDIIDDSDPVAITHQEMT